MALITGTASGMGRLAARRLAAGGARVAVFDVNEPGLRQTRGDDERIHPSDRNAAITVWLRRHLPGLLWRNIHRVEGF